MLVHILAAVAGAKLFIKLLAGTGGTIEVSDATSPYDSNVGIRFNTDGTVEKGTAIDGNLISWSSHGTWFDPTNALTTPGNYSVRYTNLASGGSHDFTSKAAVEDTWIDISAQRSWVWNETTSTALGGNDFTCDFEVRDDVSGLSTALSSYTFRIDNAT